MNSSDNAVNVNSFSPQSSIIFISLILLRYGRKLDKHKCFKNFIRSRE